MLSGLRHSISCVKEGVLTPILHDYPLSAKDNINWYSPEMLEQNLCGYNYKADIYSIGITACELANGIVPFDPISPTEILLDKLTGRMPRLLDSTCNELKILNLNRTKIFTMSYEFCFKFFFSF